MCDNPIGSQLTALSKELKIINIRYVPFGVTTEENTLKIKSESGGRRNSSNSSFLQKVRPEIWLVPSTC